MKHITTWAIGLLSVLLLPSIGRASQWRRFGTAEGLSNNQTRQVICLPSGLMLAVVEGRIDYYDGQRFCPLELDRTLTADVHSFLNTRHYFDRQGRVWIRTLHQLTALDVHTLRPADVRQIIRSAGISGRIQNFFIDADGAAWLHVGADSLMRYDWQHPAQLMLRIKATNTDGIRSTICDIVQQGRLHYIFFSGGSMTCFDADRCQPRYTIPLGDASRGYYLQAASGREGQLLVRLSGGGNDLLVRFDTQRRCIADTLLRQHVEHFWTDARGHLWASAERQVWHFADGRRVPTVIADLPHDMHAFTADRQGGLWFCTFNDGLYYRSPQSSAVAYTRLPRSAAVNSFLRCGAELLLGSSAGLYRHGPQGWQLVPGTAHLHINRLDQGHNGHIYLSTKNHGLLELDADGRPCWSVGQATDARLRDNVGFCLDLPDGRRLFNTRLNRLVIIDPATQAFDLLSERLPHVVNDFRYIVDALPLDSGWLMATQNGLFWLRPDGTDYRIDRQRFAPLADNPWSIKFNCLLRSRHGHIWAGTQNGLLQFDESSGELRRYSHSDGLPDDCVQSIVEDADDGLWAATARGLCRIALSEGEKPQLRILNADDGLTDFDFVERAAALAPDGQLYFGTTNGFYHLSPDSLPAMRHSPVPRLISLSVANREGLLMGTDSISLSHRQNFLTFTVSTLNYAHASHTRFRYRMSGIDPTWQVAAALGDKIEISYTALPPGHRQLTIEACDQGGAWGEPLVIDIVIRPPLWRTWWAYLLYIVAALVLARLLRRAYVQQRDMRQRIAELLRERERALAAPAPAGVPDEADAPEVPTEPEPAATEAPRPAEFSAADRRFLQKALACIDRNMSNSDYTIDLFASDMAMERSTLYRRLQAVMGQAPLEFVRTIRLKRAAELIRSGKYTITEVSEMVGYNTPRYFTKHFRDMYGVRPSEYR